MKIYCNRSNGSDDISRLKALVGTDSWFLGYTTEHRIIMWYHLIECLGEGYRYTCYNYNEKYGFPMVVTTRRMEALMGDSKYRAIAPITSFHFIRPLEIYTTDELFRVSDEG